MRRTFVSFVVGTLAATLYAGSASAEKIVWNINIFGPPRGVTASIEAMNEYLKKESNGVFEMNLVYGSALGPERQAPEAIKAGGYEGAQMCAGYYPNKFPLLTVMELPFLPPRKIEDNAVVNQDVFNHPLIAKEARERWNVVYFSPAVLPAYEFMGNKKIDSVASMKGVKMRIAGLNAKALQAFGAVPTMVTAPEGYQALERGTIDSFGFPYSFSFAAYKLQEVSKFATEGLAMSGFMCWYGVSASAWDKLPASLKAKVPEAQKLGTAALLKAYKEADDKNIPMFKQKLQVIEFPAAERAKLIKASQPIWEVWAKDQESAGRPGQQMLDFVKSEVAKFKN
jgi:TRAP-type C4-dicarboxylate transport system substrate-binding protein